MSGDAVVDAQIDMAQKIYLLATVVDQDPRRLVRHINRIVHDPLMAEDLSQDTLVRAIRGLPAFRGEAKETQLCPWLDQIARNLAYNYLRDTARRPWQTSLEEKCHEEETLAEQLAVSGSDPAVITSRSETRAYLTHLVQNLPADARAVFLLREVEGLSTAATAAYLQISQDLVKWRLQRARKLLRQQLLATPDASALC